MNIMKVHGKDVIDIAKALGLATDNLISYEIKVEAGDLVKVFAVYNAPADVLRRMIQKADKAEVDVLVDIVNSAVKETINRGGGTFR